jgi:hypothetical protein
VFAVPEAVPSPSLRTLSKSDYTAARTCPTKLYYRELHYPTIKDGDPYLAMLAQGGYMVEQIAKLHYPSAIALEYGRDPVADAELTARHLASDRVTLFEATLLSGHKLARVDILQKDGNSFRAIEVKAKTFDSRENAARLLNGKPSLFRSTRPPHAITNDWDKYLADITFQVMVLRELHPTATIRPFLCLVDTSRTTSIDGLPGWFQVERRMRSDGTETIHRVRFTGDVERMRADDLLVEVDVSDEVALLMPGVMEESERFVASIHPMLTRLAPQPGMMCKKCEYRFTEPIDRHGFAECWEHMATVSPSVLDLYHPTPKTVSLVDGLIGQGRVSLYDVPMNSLRRADGSRGAVATRQLIQIEHTRRNEAWHSPALAQILRSVEYPLHFIDFEAARLSVPPHAGMHPYGLLAFQWSCHTIQRPGAPLTHKDWLNTVDFWPNARFARSLREVIGQSGTVLAWATFEASVLKEILKELGASGQSDPELEAWIGWITEKGRILDLNQVTRDHFFHPAMGGRTSIKVVLDALWRSDAAMRARFTEVTRHPADADQDPYHALPELEINGKPQAVVEGTSAICAYEAMMYGAERNEPATKTAWETLLKQYCALDTLAMVLIWEHWRRECGVAG